jgi:hypothetical protein
MKRHDAWQQWSSRSRYQVDCKLNGMDIRNNIMLT